MILGMDIGSRQVKLAWETQGGVQRQSLPTARFYKDVLRLTDRSSLTFDFGALHLPAPDRLVATGYGRHNIHFDEVRVISEIQAHALGASVQTPWHEFLLLDLGGQDTKVILVKDGHVEDFLVNDKCAAGSGRYLEAMAQVMEISLQELGGYYLDPEEMSTTCATYAESELIGKIADGIPLARLAAGVNHSTFMRIRPMLDHWPEKQLVFSGGGAHHSALIHYLKQAGYAVLVPLFPEFTGAQGCLQTIKQELNA